MAGLDDELDRTLADPITAARAEAIRQSPFAEDQRDVQHQVRATPEMFGLPARPPETITQIPPGQNQGGGRTRRVEFVSTGDDELDAMVALTAVLGPLDDDTRRRVIRWTDDRWPG